MFLFWLLQRWLTPEESRSRFTELILMRCLVLQRNQRMVSVSFASSFTNHILRYDPSIFHPLTNAPLLLSRDLQSVEWEAPTPKLYIKLGVTKITFPMCLLFVFLADGLLTVTLKGGLPEKYTGQYNYTVLDESPWDSSSMPWISFEFYKWKALSF